MFRYLNGNDQYSKDSYIGAFAYDLFSEDGSPEIKTIFEKVMKSQDQITYSQDDTLFYILVRLYYEVQ